MSLGDNAPADSLINALRSIEPIPSYNYRWVIADVEYLKDSNIIVGRLGKYKEEKAEVIYDESEKTFKEISVLDSATVALFVIDVDPHLIAFQVTSQIKPEVFVNRFKELMEKSRQSIEFTVFTEEGMGFLKFLESSIVTKATVHIIHPNPAGKDLYRGWTRELDNTNSESIRSDYTGKSKGGLTASEDTLLRQAGYMESDGYAEIAAEVDGVLEYQTKKHIKTVILTSPLSEIREIAELIAKTVRRITDRRRRSIGE